MSLPAGARSAGPTTASGEPAVGRLHTAASPAEEHRLAVRNAAKLTVSLAVTWTIGLGVRLVLPRYLGPERFGEFNFADAFATTFLVAVGLGVESYILKTVSLRREHANEFLGTVLLVRVLLAILLVPAMQVILDVTGRPAAVRPLVWLFAVSHFLMWINGTLNALLQARGRIDGISVLNVLTKVVWALGLLVAALMGSELWTFVLPAVVSEAVRTPVLWALARRHVGLRLRFEPAAGAKALRTSLPFYANAVAITVFGKLDITFLAALASPAEVGYYGAATAIGALALLATPIIGPVLFPLLSRAAARSELELSELVRRTLEITLTVAIPLSLAIALGADLWIEIVFGRAFAPAATALAIVAPTLLVTYVNMLCAVTLNALDRTWTVTLTTLAGVAMDATFNALLLRPLVRLLNRPGAGATGCALALLTAETVVTAFMLALVGRRAFDRRNASRLLKMALAAVATVGVHGALAAIGPARLLASAATYAILATATGALNVREAVAFARALRRREPISSQSGRSSATRAGPSADRAGD